jgi:hypothetical protein
MANLFFPKKIIKKMKDLGISESDIYDVFYNGVEIEGKNGMYRKYNGYEIGFFYVVDDLTNEFRLIAVWKRDRR